MMLIALLGNVLLSESETESLNFVGLICAFFLYFSDSTISSLEPCPSHPFEAAKFTCLTAEILLFLTKLSGITEEVCKILK